jgi:LAO/AO transport system kinase
VVTVSALEGRGMDTVWGIVEEQRTKLSASGALAEKRRAQREAWFWGMIDDGLKQHFLARRDVARLLPEMQEAVATSALTPSAAARRLLALLDGGDDGGERSAASRRKRSA